MPGREKRAVGSVPEVGYRKDMFEDGTAKRDFVPAWFVLPYFVVPKPARACRTGVFT